MKNAVNMIFMLFDAILFYLLFPYGAMAFEEKSKGLFIIICASLYAGQ